MKCPGCDSSNICIYVGNPSHDTFGICKCGAIIFNGEPDDNTRRIAGMRLIDLAQSEMDNG
jgi:hypothetical protein